MSAKKSSHDPMLIEQQSALADYLGAMLNERVPPSSTDTFIPESVMDEPSPEAVSLASDAEVSSNNAEALNSDEPFPAVVFIVAGIKLALPLIKMNQIIAWSQPTADAHSPHWLLGTIQYGENTVRVVDTEDALMPENRKEASVEPWNHLVLLQDGGFGLACHEVQGVQMLDPSDIQWRTTKTRRSWLAGIVRSEQCALIDTQALAVMLMTELGTLED